MEESFPEELRPDRIGVVVAWNGDDHDSVVVHVEPERAGALAHPPGAQLVEALLNSYDPVFVVCGQERVMLRRKDRPRTATASSTP
jgi:hypothetical protein